MSLLETMYDLPVVYWTREELAKYPDLPLNISPSHYQKLPSQRFQERHYCYRRSRRV